MRFQVIAGFHAVGEKLIGPGGEHGDVVESNIDLAAKHNKGPNSIKFVRLPDAASSPIVSAEVVNSEPVEVQSEDAALREKLEGMTVADLKAYAEEHDVPLTGKTVKADILEAILFAVL